MEDKISERTRLLHREEKPDGVPAIYLYFWDINKILAKETKARQENQWE